MSLKGKRTKQWVTLKKLEQLNYKNPKFVFQSFWLIVFGFLEKIIRQNIKLSIELYRIHLNWVHIFLMRDKYIFNSVVYTFILFNFLLLFKVFQYYVFAFSVHYEIFIWNLHRIYIYSYCSNLISIDFYSKFFSCLL